jgi:tripartite-type tricarboxylate transporter receptor subunit TctC
MNRRKTLVIAAALLAASIAPQGAAAQTADAWPSRPISLVVPYPPGGTSDVIGRYLGERLREDLGATVVVENKAGAATAIGAAHVARAAKDGYTLLLSAGTTFTTNPHMNEKLAYRLEDFEPVALVGTVPFAFVVKKDLPVRDVREFAAYAKSNPGKVNNATNGQGSMVHLLGELVAQGLGVQLNQVHYKGAAPATADMIGGFVDSNVEALTSAVPNLATGRYRALAVLSAERLPLLPDVPTFRELGYPSIVGDPGTRCARQARRRRWSALNASLRKIVASQGYVEFMRKHGNEARSSTPAELLELSRQQHRSWGELISKVKLKPQ